MPRSQPWNTSQRENQIESDRINVYVRTYGVRISSGSRPFLVYLCNVWLLCQDCSKSKIDCRPSIFQALTAFCSIKLWCVRFYLINLLIEYCFYTFGLCWIRKKRILPIEIEQNRNAEKKCQTMKWITDDGLINQTFLLWFEAQS